MFSARRTTVVTIETDQQLSDLIEESSFLYVTDPSVIERVAFASQYKICYVCLEDSSTKLADSMLGLRMIVFSSLETMKVYLTRLAQLNLRVLNLYGAKVVVANQGVQVLLLSSVAKSLLED